VRAEELLAPRMISLHNLRYLHRLMEMARTAIQAHDYGEFVRDYAHRRFGPQVPQWFTRALQEGGHWN
jgi:queuine tRNA-ribosyltransferase